VKFWRVTDLSKNNAEIIPTPATMAKLPMNQNIITTAVEIFEFRFPVAIFEIDEERA
jgi:hypothetical protein